MNIHMQGNLTAHELEVMLTTRDVSGSARQRDASVLMFITDRTLVITNFKKFFLPKFERF